MTTPPKPRKNPSHLRRSRRVVDAPSFTVSVGAAKATSVLFRTTRPTPLTLAGASALRLAAPTCAAGLCASAVVAAKPNRGAKGPNLPGGQAPGTENHPANDRESDRGPRVARAIGPVKFRVSTTVTTAEKQNEAAPTDPVRTARTVAAATENAGTRKKREQKKDKCWKEQIPNGHHGVCFWKQK